MANEPGYKQLSLRNHGKMILTSDHTLAYTKKKSRAPAPRQAPLPPSRVVGSKEAEIDLGPSSLLSNVGMGELRLKTSSELLSSASAIGALCWSAISVWYSKQFSAIPSQTLITQSP